MDRISRLHDYGALPTNILGEPTTIWLGEVVNTSAPDGTIDVTPLKGRATAQGVRYPVWYTPALHDIVVLGFLNGDRRQPIVLFPYQGPNGGPVNAGSSSGLEVPAGAPNQPTRAFGTAYQPNTRRPVFVTQALQVEITNSLTTSWVQCQISATGTSGWMTVAQLAIAYPSSPGGPLKAFDSGSYWVPPGWFYQAVIVTASGDELMLNTTEWTF